MRDKISELMDGELPEHEAPGQLARLQEDAEARRAWGEYHMIGDTIRGLSPVSAEFSARVMQRLRDEPIVVAPARAAPPAPLAARRWIGLQLAAGIAGVALVGWLAFVLETGVKTPAPVAQAPRPQPVAPAEVANVPPPAAAADYLLAHQRYSPRNALQGVAPYVRTVAGEAGARRP